MSDKIRIGVLFGGRSGEHDVSLMSARSVISVLSPQRYEVTPIGITRDGIWVTSEEDNAADKVLTALAQGHIEGLTRVALLPEPADDWLYARRPADPNDEIQAAAPQRLEPLWPLDVVFPVMHGTFSEDGTMQGWLEITDVAYVGPGVLASSVCMDKGLFKDVMREHDIPVLEWVIVTRDDVKNKLENIISQAEALADYPLFVKPCNLGSSVGVTRCRGRSDLVEGLLDAARYDRRIIIERGLNAREVEVSVLGNEIVEVSGVGEIIPSDDFYSYNAKYVDDQSDLLIPAPLPETVSEVVRDLARRAFRAVDGAGMARVDFLLEKETLEIYLNEANTIPGFTKISMYPKLWEASGLPYPQLVDRLIELALERKRERDNTERDFDGVFKRTLNQKKGGRDGA